MTASATDYKTAGDYLAAADVEFAAGNHDAGSTLLMQSAHCALAQLAPAYGRSAETDAERREFAEWLDKERDADGWHARNLRTADIIGTPDKLDALPPDRRHYYSKSAVREFIAAMLAYQLGELKAPGDYLTASDREFAAGNYDEGSTLLTQSAHHALAQLAKEAGKSAGNRKELREFAEWLDRKHGTDGWYARKLRTANGFDDNARYGFMHADDLDFIRPLVREFVVSLLSYRREPMQND